MIKIDEIDINNLKFLGSGSASDVYLLSNDKVLVVGRREDCFLNYQNLFEKSKLIDGKITTICYPKIYEVIKPCNKFLYGAMIEQYVEGIELRKIQKNLTIENKLNIGKTIANFLNELHCIECIGNKQEEIKINVEKFNKSVILLSNYLDKHTLNKIDLIKDKYISLMNNSDFCLTHGDLNAGNILVDNSGNLSGIIDFGNMEYYVPEVEFAHIYFFDKIIYESMKQSYFKSIDDKSVMLLELVMNIRHFKNIKNDINKRENCLNNIKHLLEIEV